MNLKISLGHVTHVKKPCLCLAKIRKILKTVQVTDIARRQFVITSCRFRMLLNAPWKKRTVTVFARRQIVIVILLRSRPFPGRFLG